MRRFGLKALFTLLAVNRTGHKRFDWDRVILIFSTFVTVGLVALYLYGKATSRWYHLPASPPLLHPAMPPHGRPAWLEPAPAFAVAHSGRSGIAVASR
jgi:hypothetical protein